MPTWLMVDSLSDWGQLVTQHTSLSILVKINPDILQLQKKAFRLVRLESKIVHKDLKWTSFQLWDHERGPFWCMM